MDGTEVSAESPVSHIIKTEKLLEYEVVTSSYAVFCGNSAMDRHFPVRFGADSDVSSGETETSGKIFVEIGLSKTPRANNGLVPTWASLWRNSGSLLMKQVGIPVRNDGSQSLVVCDEICSGEESSALEEHAEPFADVSDSASDDLTTRTSSASDLEETDFVKTEEEDLAVCLHRDHPCEGVEEELQFESSLVSLHDSCTGGGNGMQMNSRFPLDCKERTALLSAAITLCRFMESESFTNSSNAARLKRKPYKCDICNNTFTQKSSLNTHMLIHKNIRPHKCEVCDKSFFTSSHRNTHMMIHNNIRPFKCDICSRSFTVKGHLNKHMLLHNDIRPFKCKLCDKSYTQERHLSEHMVTHSNIRPFECEVCNKSFLRKSELNRHKLIHDNFQPFECEVCKKTFTQQSNLNTHLATHYNIRPFRCEVCSKSFTQKCHLNSHMLTHNSANALKCDVCNKTFTHQGNLNRHMLIHSNTRPFSCDVCRNSFTQKSHLTRHLETHKSVTDAS